jgi:hypothetical protein
MRDLMDIIKNTLTEAPEMGDVSYAVIPTSEAPEALMRDMDAQGKEFIVLRTGRTGRQQIWGFFKTAELAKAACRRYRARDVVTR